MTVNLLAAMVIEENIKHNDPQIPQDQNTEDESQLVSKAQAGNPDAYSQLVSIHHRGVINVVYRLCGDVWLAQDAAQTAFIQAWKKLPGFRPTNPFEIGSSFRNWLYRIAVNVAINILRREKHHMQFEKLSLFDQKDSPEDRVEELERQAHIQQEIMDLPNASRAVIVLREYEGLTYKEIADTLEIPIGTVMSRLNYARNRLAESLSIYLEE